jgi:hypothetical protein
MGVIKANATGEDTDMGSASADGNNSSNTNVKSRLPVSLSRNGSSMIN